MKTALMTILVALTLNAAQARAPHERVAPNDMMNMIQDGKINAAMLNSLDKDIFDVQKSFEKEISLIGEHNDYTEGKIQASMITMIGDELLRIQEERAALEDKNEILDADVNPLKERLQEVRKIIGELNL